MANKLNIVITAIDNATKTINKINRQFANAMMPVTRLSRSIGNLAKASGVTKLAQGFVRVGKAAAGVAEQVAKIFAPLAAIVGVGSIAGVVALATEWGKLAMSVTNAAANIGVSASELMGLQSTARLAGVSAQELTSSLTSLGSTMEDALYGRNQGALMLMNRLGISMHRLKNGSVDTERAMKDLAGVMQRPGINGNAQVQSLIANTFGVGALLPLLRKGPQAIDEYQRKVRELGGEMSGPAIAAATEFEYHLLTLQTAVGGLRNSIGAALIPVLQPLIDQFTQWISKNRELIATKVAEYVRNIANWVKTIDFKKVGDDISKAISGVTGFVDSIGGWQVALAGILAIMGAPLLGAIAQLSAALISLGAIVWANPILAALGTIGFLSYEIYKHWNDIGVSMANATPPAFGDGTGRNGDGQTASPGRTANGASGNGNGQTTSDGTASGSSAGRPVGGWGKLGDFFGLNKTPPPGNAPLGTRSNNPLDMTTNGAERVYADPTQGIADAVANLERNYLGDFFEWNKTPPPGNAPLGIRSNNPLNMTANGAERVYADPTQGIADAVANLERNYRGLTLAQIQDKWTGGARTGNTPQQIANYTKIMSAATGLQSNAVPDLNDPRIVASLMTGMIRAENGQQPYTPAQLGAGTVAGMQQVGVDLHVHGLPAGATATATTRDASQGPTRVAFSMPMGSPS